MKTIFYTLIFCVHFIGYTQTAPLKVTVLDTKNQPYVGDQIIFEGQNSGKEIIGKTGEDGTFVVKLPAGETYNIKIKSFTATQEYSTIEVPKIGPNESFGEMQMQIIYEMSGSFTLDNLHFETGKSDIKSGSYEMLNQLVEYLKNRKDLNIEIAGHTDNVGSPDNNITLSQKRAEAVKNYLIKKGISATRLSAKGYGENRPVASNNTPEGRQKNRRTEIYIL